MQQFPSLIKYIPAQLWPVFGANFTAHRSECEHRKRIPLLSTVLDLLGEYPHLSSNACRSRLQWLPALSNTSSLRNGWLAGSLQYIFSLCNLLSSVMSHLSSVQRKLFPIQSQSGRKWKSHWAVLFIQRILLSSCWDQHFALIMHAHMLRQRNIFCMDMMSDKISWHPFIFVFL